jgi:hypothetical protein
LSAFEQLWQQGRDVNLVIVGKRGWLVDDLSQRMSEHAENGRRLFWLQGISDEYLGLIYQKPHRCLYYRLPCRRKEDHQHYSTLFSNKFNALKALPIPFYKLIEVCNGIST